MKNQVSACHAERMRTENEHTAMGSWDWVFWVEGIMILGLGTRVSRSMMQG